MRNYYVNVWLKEDGTRYATGVFYNMSDAKKNRNSHYLETDGISFSHTDEISMYDESEE